MKSLENARKIIDKADKEMAKKFNDPSVRTLGMDWYKHEYFKEYPFERGMKRIQTSVDDWLLSLGYQHDRENYSYRKVGKSPERVALFAHHGASMMILSSILDVHFINNTSKKSIIGLI